MAAAGCSGAHGTTQVQCTRPLPALVRHPPLSPPSPRPCACLCTAAAQCYLCRAARSSATPTPFPPMPAGYSCTNINTNPNYGYTSFDNFPAASYAIFQMLTM